MFPATLARLVVATRVSTMARGPFFKAGENSFKVCYLLSQQKLNTAGSTIRNCHN